MKITLQIEKGKNTVSFEGEAKDTEELKRFFAEVAFSIEDKLSGKKI